MVRLDGLRGAQAVAALRRPAAARRAGPRAGQPAQGAAARRAAGRARPEAARGDADRAEDDPARRRHHVHLRHPRPGRGAHHERPDRRLQRTAGSSRSGTPGRGLRGAARRRSSPGSWGRRTCSRATPRRRSPATGGTFTVRPEKIRMAEPGCRRRPRRMRRRRHRRATSSTSASTPATSSRSTPAASWSSSSRTSSTSSMDALAAQGAAGHSWSGAAQHNRRVDGAARQGNHQRRSQHEDADRHGRRSRVSALAVAAGCGGSQRAAEQRRAGGGGETATASQPCPRRSARARAQLNLIAWQGYTEPNVVKPFEAADRMPGATSSTARPRTRWCS